MRVCILYETAAVISAVLGLGALSFAAETAKITGIGAVRCAVFNQEIRPNDRVQRDYFAWAQGYMSGLLMRAPSGVDEGLELNPPASRFGLQIEFLRRFCASYPEKDYSDGALALYRVLRDARK